MRSTVIKKLKKKEGKNEKEKRVMNSMDRIHTAILVQDVFRAKASNRIKNKKNEFVRNILI